MKKPIILVLLLALIIRLLFFFRYHAVWWDGAVYLGMGRYIYSLGQAGLWEPLRPVVLPLIFGSFWKIGLNDVLFGRILMIGLSLACVYLVYLIGKEVFDNNSAVIASVLFSFSAIFFFFGFRLYTGILALFFVLLGIYLFLRGRYILSGIFIGIAFLCRFPAGMFLVLVLAFVLYKRRYFDALWVLVGFLIAAVPYLLFNWLMYGDMLLPMLSSNYVVNRVVGCNYLRHHSWWFYLLKILKDNILNIFIIAGVWFCIKKLDRKKLLILLGFALPLIYFSQLNCREYRYMILFVPFMSLLAGYGIYNLVRRFNRHWLGYILIGMIVVSALFAVSYYKNTPEEEPPEEFYRFIEGREVPGEIWVTNPLISLYADKKVELLYYPVYDADKSVFFENLSNMENISYIFLDTCGGGMICPPADDLCAEVTGRTIDMLEENFEKEYYAKYGRCEYYVFGFD